MITLNAALGNLLKSFGPPGDFGYDSEAGQMLYKFHQLHAAYASGSASNFLPAPIPDGRRTVAGKVEMRDSRGGYLPIDMVKPQHILEDELTRKIMGFWLAASEQVARLKAHTVVDIEDFIALLAQEYEIVPGGKKGNMTFQTYDALYKVEVRINDYIDFGPELQVAKQLVDECINGWAADASPEIRAIVMNAFHTEQAGQVNRSELIKLTRLSIEDERWQRGMQAIRDAQRVIGTKQYIRCYQRDRFDGPWKAVSIDMAKA